MVSIFQRKLPSPIFSRQRIPLPLLDLMKHSEAVILCCCGSWWQHVWVDGLLSGGDQLLEALIPHGILVVIQLPFLYDGHGLLTSCNDLVF